MGRLLTDRQVSILRTIQEKFPTISKKTMDKMLNTTYNCSTRMYEIRDDLLEEVFICCRQPDFDSMNGVKFTSTTQENGSQIKVSPSNIMNNTELFIKYSNEAYLRQKHERFVYNGVGWEKNLWKRPNLGTEENSSNVFFELIEHIFGNTTDENGTLISDHFYDWASYVLCHDGSGPNWHWIIESSVRGNGKTSIAMLLQSILGDSNVVKADGTMLRSSFSSGEFNSKELIILDELGTNMNIMEKRNILENLKSLSTSETFNTVSKGKMSTVASRTFGMFATTNDVSDLSMERGDRRWAVHSTDVEPREDSFYLRLNNDMKDKAKLNHFKRFLENRFNANKEKIITKCKQVAPKTISKDILTLHSVSTAEFAIDFAIENSSFGSNFGYTSPSCTEPIFSLASVSVDGFRDGRDCSVPDMIRKISKVVKKKGYVLMDIDNGNPDKSVFSSRVSRKCVFAVSRKYINEVYNKITSEAKDKNKSEELRKEWERKLKSEIKTYMRQTYLEMYLSHTGGIKDESFLYLQRQVECKVSSVSEEISEPTISKEDKVKKITEEIEKLKKMLESLTQ